MKKLIRYLWIFFVLLHKMDAWFEDCHGSGILSDKIQKDLLFSKNYPNQYPPGSSCIYQLTAPLNSIINLECNVTTEKNGANCDSDALYVSFTGDTSLKDSVVYCGNGSFERNSIKNELTWAYISSNESIGGRIFCSATFTKLVDCDCGWSLSSKIVGGIEATVYEYPFMAGIVNLQRQMISCGGSIISSRFVLSAAICLDKHDVNSLGIIVGEYDTETAIESRYTKLYRVDQIIIHNGYYRDSDVIRNNIGLLKASPQIEFSAAVGAVCLPFLNMNNFFVDYPADIMGWGTTSFSGTASDVLLKATVQVQNNDNCKVQYPNLVKSNICTYSNQKDSCQYDSGGPVIIRDSRMFLIGIISYGKACNTSFPSINERVTSHLNWIQYNTNERFCLKQTRETLP